MRLTVFAVLVSAAALSACAGTQSTSSTTAPVTTAAAAPAGPTTKTEQVAEADSADPIICQKEPDSTSRVRRNKVCMHRSQWEARSDADQKALGEARGPGINPGGGGN